MVLRFPAKICGFLRFSATPKPLDLQSEPKISENLRSRSGFSLLLSPFWRALIGGCSLHDSFGSFDSFDGSGEHLALLFACPTKYPLARNQYINNSPGIFSCIVRLEGHERVAKSEGYQNQSFSSVVSGPFLPPFFPHFSLLFPLQALFSLPPLLPSSPPPLSPLF